MQVNLGSQLISKLGSPNSKLPLAAKDLFNSAGYTYFSYDAGGKVEGKDRFVDELGTGLIWLFGIHTYKNIIDKTIFKAAKISPDVDVRILKNKDYLNSAIENAPTESIVKDLKRASENITKTKGLTLLKFALALGMTMASYFALTKFKQNMTKKAIEKEFMAKKVKEQKNNVKQNNFEISPIFKDFADTITKNNPSFGSSAAINIAEEFMLNPIKNMIILDAGISTSRIKNARTKGEAAEYAIKEGSFLFFVYGAGKVIQKGIDKLSEKLFKIPISLDAQLLSSQSAKDILTNPDLQKDINDFSSLLKKKDKINNIYDFIFKNQDNIIVTAAKKSGIISTIKDATGKEKIDTRKYIDIKDLEKLTKDLTTFIDNSKNKDIKTYLNKVKTNKVTSTIINVGICCLALGYIVPKMMYKYRKDHQNGKNDFHVKTEYEKELAAKQMNPSLK